MRISRQLTIEQVTAITNTIIAADTYTKTVIDNKDSAVAALTYTKAVIDAKDSAVAALTYTKAEIDTKDGVLDTYIDAVVDDLGITKAGIVGLNSNQGIYNGVASQVLWDLTIANRGGMVGSGADAYRIVIPQTGIYAVAVSVAWNPNATGVRICYLLDANGRVHLWDMKPGSGTQVQTNTPSGLLYLLTGNWLGLYVYQDSGASRILTPNDGDKVVFAVVEIG